MPEETQEPATKGRVKPVIYLVGMNMSGLSLEPSAYRTPAARIRGFSEALNSAPSTPSGKPTRPYFERLANETPEAHVAAFREANTLYHFADSDFEAVVQGRAVTWDFQDDEYHLWDVEIQEETKEP